MAASNFATPDTVQAETEAVTASGIKSAETVQLGQSGPVFAALYSFVTRVEVAVTDTAKCNAGLQISPVGVGAWSWGDRTGKLTFTVLCSLLAVLLGSHCHKVAALSRILSRILSYYPYMHYLAGTSLQALFCRNSFACTELHAGYWGYGNEYQKDDNLEAYKAVVGNGISFIDTSEVRVASACHLFSIACLWATSASLHFSTATVKQVLSNAICCNVIATGSM